MHSDTCSGSASQRIAYLDWIRAAATTAVVLLHVFQTPSSLHSVNELGLARAIWYTELQAVLTRWAVPAFLMVTGALLLDPAKDLPVSKQRRYIVRMLKVLASFGLAFCLAEERAATGHWSVDVVLKAVANLFSGHSWSHMWYVYALVGFYLMLPLLRPFAAHASRSEYRRMLVIVFVLSFAIPSLNWDAGTTLATFYFSFAKAPFYALLGHYLHRWCHFNRLAFVLGFLAVLTIAAASAAFILTGRGGYGMRYFDYYSPLIPMYATAIFLAFKRYAPSPLPRPVATLARYSFGIYLIHPVFLNFLNKVYVPELPPVAIEATDFAIAIVGATFLTALMRRLPFFRTIL